MIVEREHLERLTKPQLVDATILAEQRARDAAPPRPVVVHEADALAGCIRALDLLNEAERRGNSANIGMSGYVSNFDGSHQYRHQGSVERVLRLLAARYTVPLIEQKTEPCARPHVDSIDQYALQSALASAARPGVSL